MPRPNPGPQLSDGVNEHGHIEIKWTERGRSKRRSTGTGDRAEASRVLAAFILHGGAEAPTVDVPTVAQAVDAYLAEHCSEKVKGEGTHYSAQHVRAYFGPIACSDVTPGHVAEFNKRRRAGKIGRCAGNGTLRRDLGVLIAAINWMVTTKKLAENLVPHIPLPAEPPPKNLWLERDQAKVLLLQAARHRSKRHPIARTWRFLILGLETAARRGALEGLTWSQVDLKRGVLHLRPEGQDETKKRRPIIPISDRLARHLRTWKRTARTAWVLGAPGSVRKGFEKVMWEVAQATGRPELVNVTPHTLRHTWATWAAQDGVSMWDIAGILGDDLATVEKRYAHHAPDYLRGAVNRSPRRVAASA